MYRLYLRNIYNPTDNNTDELQRANFGLCCRRFRSSLPRRHMFNTLPTRTTTNRRQFPILYSGSLEYEQLTLMIGVQDTETIRYLYCLHFLTGRPRFCSVRFPNTSKWRNSTECACSARKLPVVFADFGVPHEILYKNAEYQLDRIALRSHNTNYIYLNYIYIPDF